MTVATLPTIPVELFADPPEIQCECNHDDGQCTATATVAAQLHCLDACDQPDAQPHGHEIRLLCWPCIGGLYITVCELLIGTMMRGGEPECSTCHRPTLSVHDLLRIRPL